jgi:membrane-associated phospholipid phosphatase
MIGDQFHSSDHQSGSRLINSICVLLFCSSAIATSPAGCQERANPPARRPVPAINIAAASSAEPLFTGHDLAFPAALAIGTTLLLPLDERIALRLQDSSTQENRFLRVSASGFRILGNPGALGLSLAGFAAGRLAHSPHLAETGLRSSEALLLGSAAGFVIKGLVGRARPFVVHDSLPGDVRLGRGFVRGYDYASFPSGHTIAAFAMASAVTAELARWSSESRWYVGVPFYASAGMVGLSRLYNDQHWASDVMASAAIGTFAGIKVVRYHHAHPASRVDRALLSISIPARF